MSLADFSQFLKRKVREKLKSIDSLQDSHPASGLAEFLTRESGGRSFRPPSSDLGLGIDRQRDSVVCKCIAVPATSMSFRYLFAMIARNLHGLVSDLPMPTKEQAVPDAVRTQPSNSTKL
jgi:hypothetical protein